MTGSSISSRKQPQSSEIENSTVSTWDDTRVKEWPVEHIRVDIPSGVDGEIQRAYFYKSRGVEPRPLIVSLHTWSADYQQEDPLARQAIDSNFNYIHPDFRGPNTTPDACGSSLVVADIEDAIAFSKANGLVDPGEIHIIGVSGGGFATLMVYMRSKLDIRSYSAWVPISNLVDWYQESIGRGREYAKHIAMATTGLKFEDGRHYIDVEEARRRSPIYLETPIGSRQNTKLRIFAGIHDGHTGSVPISHSLNMYNKLVADFDATASCDLIPVDDIVRLLTYRSSIGDSESCIGDRKIHYRKTYSNLLELTIFEGGHEMLSDVALDHVHKRHSD